MKKAILLIVLIFGISSINAQITIRNKKVVERPVSKPKQFDSLTDIKMQLKPVFYKKYMGYQLYFRPKSKNYETDNHKERKIKFLFSMDTVQITKSGKIPYGQTGMASNIFGDNISNLKGEKLERYTKMKEEYDSVINKGETNIYIPHFFHKKTSKADGEIYGEIATTPDSVYGKYFTILNIKAKTDAYSKKYKDLKNIDAKDLNPRSVKLKVILKNESNKDTLYWLVKARFLGDSPFFLVPYFQKLREKYLNKKLMLKYKDKTVDRLENLIDVNTGTKVNIKYNEPWTCKDITFVNSRDYYYIKCFFFLENNGREVKIAVNSNLIPEYFMTETAFKQRELERKKAAEQRRREKIAREKKRKQEQIQYKNNCIAKWGKKMGTYIANGKVILGMSKRMCRASWGTPLDINKTILKGLVSEQWVYGWGTYLYFENGVLNAIQN